MERGNVETRGRAQDALVELGSLWVEGAIGNLEGLLQFALHGNFSLRGFL